MKNKKNYIALFVFMFFAVLVSAQPTFTISLKIYQLDCELSAAGIHAWGGTPPYQYTWSHGAVGDTLSSVPEGGYWVKVTDSSTPANDSLIEFYVDKMVCKVGFDNRFTPNGDGINDHWGAGSKIKEYPHFLLQVYDRWGQLVHQQRESYTPWDGTHLGVKVAEATYYWIFFYKEGDSRKIEKGNVTIIR